MIQNLFSINGLGQPFNCKNFISDFPVRSEINIRIFSAGRPDLIQFDLLQRTFSGGCLLGFGSICGETGNEFLQFLDLLFLFLICFLHLFDQKLAGFIPEIVISGIKLDLAIINICRMGTYLVQEITVMGYHNNCIFKIDQEFFQPCNSVQIQVVGRLIQKQNVRISK